jgi:effector-binding domain-containing protein
MYDIRVERLTARPLAVVRLRASQAELSTVVPQGCGVVWTVIRGLHLQGAGRNVALYLDGEINLEAGVELSGPFSGHGDVVASATLAGEVATTAHLGPYSRLGEAHAAIRQWCTDHQRTLAGPCWEIYGHWQSEWDNDPGKIRTDVFYLLG